MEYDFDCSETGVILYCHIVIKTHVLFFSKFHSQCCMSYKRSHFSCFLVIDDRNASLNCMFYIRDQSVPSLFFQLTSPYRSILRRGYSHFSEPMSLYCVNIKTVFPFFFRAIEIIRRTNCFLSYHRGCTFQPFAVLLNFVFLYKSVVFPRPCRPGCVFQLISSQKFILERFSEVTDLSKLLNYYSK